MKKGKEPKCTHRKLPQAIFHAASTVRLSEDVIRETRASGMLNLTSQNLSKVPECVFEVDRLSADEKKGLEVKFDDDNGIKWWHIRPLTILVINNNCIQSIPTDIKCLTELEELEAKHNSIREIADEIRECKKLHHLELDDNKITNLPEGVYCLANLKTFSASYNSLEVVSNSIGNLSVLTSLNLSNNSLSVVPDNIGFLGRLSDINLSYNNLKSVPIELTTLCALKTLNLSHNQLSSLPTFEFLQKLEELNLMCNYLEKIPDVSNCTKLRRLNLSYNEITEFDTTILNTSMRLEVLLMCDNLLTSLPEEICNLTSLNSLDVSNNKLNMLPLKLCKLKYLRYLLVAENPLKTIPSYFVASGSRQLLFYLKQKYIAEEALVVPDNTVGTAVQKFSVDEPSDGTGEEAVDRAVMARSDTINLSSCSLSEVPKNFQDLELFVVDMNLSHNKIRAIPPSIGCFRRLVYLSLSRNRLSTLPSELADCRELKSLRLDQNNFVVLPEVVFELVGLEMLNVKGNKIESVDARKLQNLKRLSVLDLSDNSIAYIPPEIGKMIHLMDLKLKGNPFRVPNYQVLQQGTQGILKYLRDKIPVDKDRK